MAENWIVEWMNESIISYIPPSPPSFALSPSLNKQTKNSTNHSLEYTTESLAHTIKK